MSSPSERIRTLSRHLKSDANGLLSMKFQRDVHTVKIEPLNLHRNQAFSYTIDSPKLAFNERQFYDENGYLLIKGLVPSNHLESYRKHFDEICEGVAEAAYSTIIPDVGWPSKRVISMLTNFYKDEILFNYCRLSQILDYAECFCGSNIIAMHSVLLNKLPDAGTYTSRQPLHQDLLYFPVRPANKIACTWTAMTHQDRESGCFTAIPGSHKWDLMQHVYPQWEGGVNRTCYGAMGIKPEDKEKRIHIEMEPGDTLFYHPLLVHGSGTNRSSKIQQSICCYYAASECQYIDVQGTVHENIAVEQLQDAQNSGINVNGVKDMMQQKTQLVRGIRVNL